MILSFDARAHTESSVVALGMFDGVHLGHRILLRKGRALADRRGVPLVCCTFAQHPMALIAPDKCPPLLTTMDERARIMESLGVDILSAPEFDESTRMTPPEVFVGELLRRWHPKHIVVGYNYTFGARGAGNAAFLSGLGQALGFSVCVVPQVRFGGMEVSSTHIRALISGGDVSTAALLLGRPYAREMARAGENLYAVLDNGKLTPPAGWYRTLMRTEGGARPVLMALDGHCASVVSKAPLGDEVSARLLAYRPFKRHIGRENCE